MAITLPTFADVGVVDPRSVGSQPSYPANDAVAEGTTALSKGIEKVGGTIADYAAEQQRNRNAVNEALATADLEGNLIRDKELLANETDPEKIDAIKGRLRGYLDRAGKTITDPEHRELWAAQHSVKVAQTEAIADVRQHKIYDDRFLAGASSQLTDLSRLAAQASNPEDREESKRRIGEVIGSLEKAGVIGSTKAGELMRGYGEDIITGHAQWLDANGKPGEGLAFTMENARHLDPKKLEALTTHLRPRAEKDAGNALMQGTGPGAAGGASNPGSLAMAAAAVDPAIETAVAKKIATTSGLQHWAGIDPDTGKPWNPDLRAAFQAAGLPVDGPISEAQWKQADPLILKHESMGGQNVPNYRFDSTHTAGGPHQITNSTWKEFGGPELMAGKGGAKAASPTGELEKAYPDDPRLKSGPLATGSGAPAIEVWGDSLGVGLKGQLKSPGKVHGGDTPTTILGNIKAQPEDSWQGKTVVLPSGSNGNEMSVVEDTIKYLKDKGANVVAVGYGPKFADKNAELAKIAQRQGVQVVAAEDVAASEGVHPSPNGYASMAGKIRGLAQAPAAAAPTASAAPGAAEPPGPPDWRGWADRIEASGAAREVKDQAIAALKHKQGVYELGQSQAGSDLALAVARGEAGRPEIETAYQQSKIAPAVRTHLNQLLDKQDQERDAQAEAILKVSGAGNGGAPLDPKSDYDKKAINLHYSVTAKGWPADQALDRSLSYAAQYGMVPDGLKAMVRGGLHSGRPDQAVVAADTVNRLRNANPQLVGEIGDENDLRLATLISTYSSAGVAPEPAVKMAVEGMKVNKTDREARTEDFEQQRGKSEKERRDADDTWIAGQKNSLWVRDPNVDPVMRKEFEELSKAEYQRTGNLEAARRLALDGIDRTWARSRVGGDLRYMKFAPEKFYGLPTLSIDENSRWMNEQLLADVSKGAAIDPSNPITTDRLRLLPAPDKANGGAPVYQVWLVGPEGNWQQVIDGKGAPVTWFPDWNTSADRKRREDAKQGSINRAIEQRRQIAEPEPAVPNAVQ